jgi:hypothetical protein
MLPQFLKELIEQQARIAYMENPPTLLSYGLGDFLRKDKKDTDYLELLKETKEVIVTNPLFAKKYLGRAFDFFKCFEVIKVNVNHADVDALLKDIFSKPDAHLRKDEIDSYVANMVEKKMKEFGAMVSGVPVDKMAAAERHEMKDTEKPLPEKINEGIRRAHIDVVGELYEKFKQHLNLLFTDMVPNPYNRASVEKVNIDIAQAYEYLTELRNLAVTKPGM